MMNTRHFSAGSAMGLMTLLSIPISTLCAAESNQAIQSPRESEKNLLSRWQFDSKHFSGKVFKPLAGKLDATLIGPVRFSKSPPNALLLDGDSKQKHSVAITSDISRISLPKQEITAEAWVKIEKPQEWGGLIGVFQDNGAYETGWLLGFQNSQFTFALSTVKAKKLTYLSARRTFEPGFWYHVVGTFDGTKQRIYVDGQLAGEATVQSGEIFYPPKAFYTIGAYHDFNDFFAMQGEIEQVSLWDRALTSAEIQKRFLLRKSLFPDIDPIHPKVTDWPTWRRDNQRTGIAKGNLKLPLNLKWVHKARFAPQPGWPEPAKQDFWHKKKGLNARVTYDRAFHVVTVGSHVYFASSADDQVHCLNAKTGRELWSFFTEGPVRLAPTVAGNRLLFGSDDGYVYCLNRSDGLLQWKFRLGPTDRRIPGNGRVISVWPVRTGVLVEGNLAYFCAGLFPSQGVFQAAVDIRTGEKIADGRVEVSAQGFLERRAGKLYVATGRDPVGAFVAKLQRRGKGIGHELSKIQTEYPYEFIGTGDLRFGGGDGKIAGFRVDDGKNVWSAKVEGKAYSMAVAGEKLYVSTDAGRIYCFSSGTENATEISKPIHIEPSPTVEFPYQNAELKKRTEDAAEWILDHTNITRGYCLVLESGHGELAYELLRRSNLHVIGVEADSEKADFSRKALDAAGFAGRVSIHHRNPKAKLPYTDYMFNLVVSGGLGSKTDFSGSREEASRVLRPGSGVALFGRDEQQQHRRKSLKGIGEWTHMYADAANTVCSGDERVGGEMALQWYGRPGPVQMIDRHHRTVAPLWKSGRLFIPGNNRVFAVDAYNGMPLWSVEIPNSRRIGAYRDCSYLVATDDYLYVAADGRCLGINAETGSAELNFSVPKAKDGKPRDWGYVANVKNILFGSATKQGAARRGHSLKAINEGSFWDARPLVTSETLFALDRHEGTSHWTYDSEWGSIINSTITIGAGRVYFVESGNEQTLKEPSGRSGPSILLGQGAAIVTLDINTGRLIWRRPINLSAIQHSIHVSFAQGKLAVVGSRNSGKNRDASKVFYDVHVLEAKNGFHVWSTTQNQDTKIGGDHGEQDHHPVIVADRLYCEPFAYELHTGKPIKEWNWLKKHRRGCGNISASASTFFFRQSNPTMFDLATNQYSKVTTSTRPGCWINMIPAGGLLLIPEASSGCTCNYAVQTSLAFLPVASTQNKNKTDDHPNRKK